MAECRRLVAILAAIPIAGGCNAILGIESHSLARPPDGGSTTDAEGVVPAPARTCFTMPNPPGTALPNPASYRKNADGTVTDNVTGLIWEGTVGATLWTQRQAIDFCHGQPNGDWRLPTRIELTSLVDFTIAKPGPAINPIFAPTPPEKFWTSSHSAVDPSIGWFVGFDYGSTHQDPESAINAYRVRCVRGVPSNCSLARYQVRADQTVHDDATGLTWQQTVDPQKRIWSDAKAYCLALGTGWRLPSLTELQTIVDETEENPAIYRDAFPGTPPMNGYFWTSSPQAGRDGFAWYVTFIHGHSDVEPTTTAYWVRCVR